MTAKGAPSFIAEHSAAYLRDGLWQNRTIGTEFKVTAKRHASRTALVSADGRWTYRELDELSDAFATGVLLLTDLRPGDPVIFQMGNIAETVVSYYGAVKAGLIPLCTLPQHGEHEVMSLARHVEARGHLIQADHRTQDLPALARRTAANVSIITTTIVARAEPDAGWVSYSGLLEAGRRRTTRSDVPAEDASAVAVLQLSGGTTGLPKVAPRRHQEYLYNARAWAHALGIGPESVVMHPLPLLHNAGIGAAMQPAHFSGATFVLAPDAAPTTIATWTARERVTVVPVVPPAVAIRMLGDPACDEADFSSLEWFLLAGQRPPVDLFDRLESQLGIRAGQMFGMAEGMFLYTPKSSSDWARRHTIGTPVSPADEIRVLAVGGDSEVADGDLGELCCRGPYTIPGYFNAPEHNAATFTHDGFFRTGDLVSRHIVDGCAYYSIDGRIKDVINRGGEKIHADGVEEMILKHPSVRNVSVVAMPDPVLGERVCAFVVVEPAAKPPTVDELGRFLLRLGLSKFKLPERVETLAEFPLTNLGKVSKKELRLLIEKKLSEEIGTA